MRKSHRPIKPVITLIAIQLVWITLVVLWVYWYIGKHREFRSLAEKYRPELLGGGFNWPVMAEGLVMLVMILIGVYVMFVYWNRQSQLYAKQRDIISQVTHELKSPLASIQLHLETIRLRKPSGEKLETFVTTMLADTDRLHYLINNLLMAARLEQRRNTSERRMTDLSTLLTEFADQQRQTLPHGGTLTLDVAPNLKLMIDPEAMQMVLRNLFENAVLYSPGSPDILITTQLTKTGVELKIRDKGRGLEKKELKKVFDMFYRVQSPGENIRGTGLGLYIIASILESWGGNVSVESDGLGKGCTFRLLLPVT